MRPFVSGIVGLTIFLVMSAAVHAHDSRPISLNISEEAEHIYRIKWTVPGSVRFDDLPSPTMPKSCHVISAPTFSTAPGKRIGHSVARCSSPLHGLAINLTFPSHNPSLTSVVRLSLLSGEEYSAVIGPGDWPYQVPFAATSDRVSAQYFGLGIGHISTGYDHLLFLFCVLFLARTPKRIFYAITGFTLAHSVTLALSTFGLVGVSITLIEALIALSIVFVATEIARGNRNSLTHSYPVLVTSLFGLLHGFGFASALLEIGLPQTQLPLALLMFNLGIEAGQIFAVVLAFAFFYAGRALWRATLPLSTLAAPQSAFIYPVGILAAYWFVERVTIVF